MGRNMEFHVPFTKITWRGTRKFRFTFAQIIRKGTWKFPCTFTKIIEGNIGKFPCTLTKITWKGTLNSKQFKLYKWKGTWKFPCTFKRLPENDDINELYYRFFFLKLSEQFQDNGFKTSVRK